MNHRRSLCWVIALLALTSSASFAALPAPATGMKPWVVPWSADLGAMSADALLPHPAGAGGFVSVKDAHFMQNGKRLRLLGMSIVFGAAFPEHAQADKIARHLALIGCNAVRLHHIDLAPFPTGLFADASLEKFSPEALDRLDYFIAALKQNGIYIDLNLHVSRDWARAHHLPNSEHLPDYGKMVDIFDPDLIAPQKQYARDLLTHVNAYTHARYADEPAIAIIEINNEDTLFLWGGETQMASIPEPYIGKLGALWNQWLVKKYPTREALKAVWSQGAEPAGKQVLNDPEFASIGKEEGWILEQQGDAHMDAKPGNSDNPSHGVDIHVTHVDDTVWHLQFQTRITVKAGQYYTLHFRARAEEPIEMTASVAQAHEPWQNLGLGETVKLTPKFENFDLGFVAANDDKLARLTFLVGRKATTIQLSNLSLTPGGQIAIGNDEDPARNTVARGGPRSGSTLQRRRDWYAFLQQTDQTFFQDMSRFLKDDLAVKCPVTGSIGLGILGTLSQSHMDFVDAHAYWDHPEFPHRQWDFADWTVHNKPMVDAPAEATLWGLAATRVAGKPFTVTEYNHAAPNEWQAECLPIIASYAATQDWDAVFLFDFASESKVERDSIPNFFDLTGNVVQTAGFPMAARIFLGGGVAPLPAQQVISPARMTMLDTASAYYWEQWPFLRNTQQVTWKQLLNTRTLLNFTATSKPPHAVDTRADTIEWSAGGPDSASGRFILKDPRACAFVGFANGSVPIDVGAMKIESMKTQFAALMLTAANPSQPIATADRLLLSAIARQSNTDMKWRDDRRTVGTDWGHGPSLVEVVHAKIQITTDRPLEAWALNSDGKRGRKLNTTMKGNVTTIELGGEPTLWYELIAAASK